MFESFYKTLAMKVFHVDMVYVLTEQGFVKLTAVASKEFTSYDPRTVILGMITEV